MKQVNPFETGFIVLRGRMSLGCTVCGGLMRPNARYEAARARRMEEEEAEAPVPEKEYSFTF
jgi:hypothetical protein